MNAGLVSLGLIQATGVAFFAVSCWNAHRREVQRARKRAYDEAVTANLQARVSARAERMRQRVPPSAWEREKPWRDDADLYSIFERDP